MSAMKEIDELAAKMDALGLWERLLPYTWAIKPRGTVFPYFCQLLPVVPGGLLKARMLILEGWQTLHECAQFRSGSEAGYVSAFMELVHFDFAIMSDDKVVILRCETGYAPIAVTDAGRLKMIRKILWESYGLMLRLEAEPQLPLKYAAEKAIFARVEEAPGKWVDRPLEIPEPRRMVQKVTFNKGMLGKAKDLPIKAEVVWDVDFRLHDMIVTKDPRPRSIYILTAKDHATGEKVLDLNTTINSEIGLAGMWESMPEQILRKFVQDGLVPGEIRVSSQRMFRLLRPLGMELPIKLSLHIQEKDS